MTKTLFAAAAFLTAFTGWGQIQITSLSPTGRLTWTNLANPLAGPFTYKVEWSSNLNGTVLGSLRVTNQTHAQLTNFPSTIQSRLYYRVIWDQGRVWTLDLYSESSLVATGKIYVAGLSFNPYPEGRYYMQRLPVPGGPSLFNLAPQGVLLSHVPIDAGHEVGIEFRIGGDIVIDGPQFWIEGAIPTLTSWSGTWHESYWTGGMIDGEFTAHIVNRGR